MKPLFKWSGGKSKEINKIINHIPKNYDTYFEPFVGGGALWLHLEHSPSVVNDNYYDVANFYLQLQKHKNDFIKDLNDFSTAYNNADKKTKEEAILAGQEFYYRYRDTVPSCDRERAIRFYVLRQLSFSGMLRFNKSGGYNVPFGWYKKMKLLPHLSKSQLDFLSQTTILNCDWETSLASANENDFVFLDPPYTTTFNKYHPNGDFGKKQHQELAKWFCEKHAKAMIIINKDEFTEGLYKDFILEDYDHEYSIRFKDRITKKQATNKHILATNFITEGEQQ